MAKKRYSCGYCGKEFGSAPARSDHETACTAGMKPGMRQRADGTNFRPGN